MIDKDSNIRKDLGNPHPLFMGQYGQYFIDQRWRADIPKVGAGNGWFGRQRQTAPRKSTRIRKLHETEGNNPDDGAMSLGLR